jgi:hypothetical protein
MKMETASTITGFIRKEYRPEYPRSAGTVLEFLNGDDKYSHDRLQMRPRRSEVLEELRDGLHGFASFMTERAAGRTAERKEAREALNAVLFERLQSAKHRVEQTMPDFGGQNPTPRIERYMQDGEVSTIAGALLILNKPLVLNILRAHAVRRGDDSDDAMINDAVDGIRPNYSHHGKHRHREVLVGTGMLNAILTCDPSQGKFATHARYQIRNGALSAMRKQRAFERKTGGGLALSQLPYSEGEEGWPEPEAKPVESDYVVTDRQRHVIALLDKIVNRLESTSERVHSYNKELLAFITSQRECYAASVFSDRAAAAENVDPLPKPGKQAFQRFWLRNPDLFVEMDKNGMRPHIRPSIIRSHDMEAQRTWAKKVCDAEVRLAERSAGLTGLLGSLERAAVIQVAGDAGGTAFGHPPDIEKDVGKDSYKKPDGVNFLPTA